MSGSPKSRKRKCMKQTTILEGFKRQQSSGNSIVTGAAASGKSEDKASSGNSDREEVVVLSEGKSDARSSGTLLEKKTASKHKSKADGAPKDDIKPPAAKRRKVKSIPMKPAECDSLGGGTSIQVAGNDGATASTSKQASDLYGSTSEDEEGDRATPSTSKQAQDPYSGMPEEEEDEGHDESSADDCTACVGVEAEEDRKMTEPGARDPELEEKPSKGVPRSELPTTLAHSPVLPPLKPSKTHTILFKITSFKAGYVPQPYPNQCVDSWDSDHVKMPCSHHSQYPLPSKGGHSRLSSRWELIKQALSQKIETSLDLQDAILKYNSHYRKKWNFQGLHAFVLDVLDVGERQQFFHSILPKMIKLALDLPNICTKAIPLLKRQKSHMLTLSQKQIASLLANAFFCTFPRRNTQQRNSEYSNYPDINFNALYQGKGKTGWSHVKVEKLKCLMNYFRRVTAKTPTGTVSFKRQVVKDFPEWETSGIEALTQLHVSQTGNIEDDGTGMLQVDFANKYLGGGVLNTGCVQEEIRFVICPEMLISRLFTEVLDRNECLIMTGCERYCNYTGYSSTFKWTGNHDDPLQRDTWGRRLCEVVAIDALVFRSYREQFQESMVRRELNKAYVGFLYEPLSDAVPQLPAVATGNWGCGVFGGDLQLKALIQLMAAAQAKRDVCYFTFGDCILRDELYNMHKYLTEKELGVSDLWAQIGQYYKTVCSKPKKQQCRLFQFIMAAQNQPSDTETDTTDDNVDGVDTQSHELAWPDSPIWAASTP